MAIPTDATHRNAGGDLFKPSKIRPGSWRQWSGAHWQRSSYVHETLTPIEMPAKPMPAGDLNDSRPAPSLPMPCAPALPPVARTVQPSLAPKWDCPPIPDEPKVTLTNYFLEYTFVGSRVTCSPPPLDTDQDVLVLIHECNRDVMERKMREDGYIREGSNPAELGSSIDKESVFFSYRKGDMNYIVTSSATFYERFKTATELARKYNLLEKTERIQLFQAVLYGKWWA